MNEIVNKTSSAKAKFFQLSLGRKLILLIIAAGVIWFGSTKFLSQEKQPSYQTSKVEFGTLVSSVSASGTVSGNNVSITTSATGIINNVYVQNGDMVVQGQKIADITPDQTTKQKQEAAWASYLSAQNTLNAAKSKMNSLQSALFTANQKFVHGAGTADPITDDPTYIIQRADWLQAESDYNNQKGVIDAAQAGVTNTWYSYQLTASTITAPASGLITNLAISPGYQIASQTNSSNSNSSSNTTSSSSSTALGTIKLDNNDVQATVNLTEIDVIKVKPGQKVTLTLDAFPDKTFTGKVLAINTNGSVSSGVVTYPASISFDSPPDNLYPNMDVNAQIITSVKNDVLLVPNAAVQKQGDQSYVRVLQNGKPVQQNVEVGDSTDTQTEITSGLNEGDDVITSVQSQTTKNSSNTSVFGGQGGFGGMRGGGNAVFRRN